jgi:hypothetical protein
MAEASTLECTSCGNALPVKGSTQFVCPGCGETTIGRCPRCRDQSVLYTCAKCGFTGP